jgi:hypothetical protein
LHDYCRDLQNGIQRSPHVDEDGNASLTGVPGVGRDDKGAPDIPEAGERPGTRREGGLEEVVGDAGVDKYSNASRTPNLSERKEDKGTVYQPFNRPSTGSSQDVPPFHHPHTPQRCPGSPKASHPDLAPPPPLTEEELLADLLKPISEFNARTGWPKASHEQPHTPPYWHADCPKGYEPSTLAGYPQRQHSTYVPAAQDADVLREKYGHYCLDLDEWDRCCMGKCGGCEICRSHM